MHFLSNRGGKKRGGFDFFAASKSSASFVSARALAHPRQSADHATNGKQPGVHEMRGDREPNPQAPAPCYHEHVRIAGALDRRGHEPKNFSSTGPGRISSIRPAI